MNQNSIYLIILIYEVKMMFFFFFFFTTNSNGCERSVLFGKAEKFDTMFDKKKGSR